MGTRRGKVAAPAGTGDSPVQTDPLGLEVKAAEARAALGTFRATLAAVLTTPWIPPPGVGAPMTLAAYLGARPKGASDEKAVVDPLTRRLLEALGWTAADWTEDSKMAADDRGRPDFRVRVPGTGLGEVAFVVEDKATDVLEFERRGRSREPASESPLDQLRRYVLNLRARGRMGLLCNGRRLEGWRFDADGASRVLHIDLVALSANLAAGAVSDGDLAAAVATLYGRFARAAFVEDEAISAGFKAPRAPPEWTPRLREALTGDDEGARLRETLSAWWEEAWRKETWPVTTHSEVLVHALRHLIDGMTADALHQLVDALKRAQEGAQRQRALAIRGNSEALWQRILTTRDAFTLGAEEFEQLCIGPLRDWEAAPELFDARQVRMDVVGTLDPHVKRAPDARGPRQVGLLDGAPATPEPRIDPRRSRKAVIAGLSDTIEKWMDAVLARWFARKDEAESTASASRTAEAYRVWEKRVSASVMVGATEAQLHSEYARQTAYVYLVRLLLVRICEDKGLFRRKLSDGGLVQWEDTGARYLDYASGRSYDYLTRMAYECAQNVYAHFYGSATVFDWYRMDDKVLVRALAVLNRFDLQGIDTDIIGTVYGQYLTEGKHEQGRYYTPRAVVETMLDLAGWTGGQLAERRLLDPACGSGSFLVAACRRILASHEARSPDGRVPDEAVAGVIEEVRGSLFGIDLNPFACYLAETNLVIQVLDLLGRARAAGTTTVLDRFHVYNDDSLLVDEALRTGGDAALALARDTDRLWPAMIKARVGPFSSGFDVVVANPPYVRADEDTPSFVRYRDSVAEQPWFTTAHLKWDLYVPFVEQAGRLLKEGPDSRACLITIESLATAPYAAKLRAWLSRSVTLHELVIAEDLRLFTDAAWQSNLIFTFGRGVPPRGHVVLRHKALRVERAGEGRDSAGRAPRLVLEALDSFPVEGEAAERLFRERPQVDLDLAGTVPFGEVCYVSKGMVLHATEHFAPGAEVRVPSEYDPADFGEQAVGAPSAGWRTVRHRPFGRDELVSADPDRIHTRPFVGSVEILRGGLGPVRWLEYGPHTRVPARVSRPTFPELYDRPKVMFGKFTGVAVDEGLDGSYLTTNDAVRLAVRWALLETVQNRALTSARTDLGSRYDPELSRGFSEWYLCALALAEPIQQWLVSNRRSMKDDVYPDDIKAIPVKRIPLDAQEPFVAACRDLHAARASILARERAGYALKGRSVVLPTWDLARGHAADNPHIRTLALRGLEVDRVLFVEPAFRHRAPAATVARGDTLFQKKAPVARIGPAIWDKEAVARVVASLIECLPSSYADGEATLRLPATEAGLLDLGAFLAGEEAAFLALHDRVRDLLAEIDRLAWDLYRPMQP